MDGGRIDAGSRLPPDSPDRKGAAPSASDPPASPPPLTRPIVWVTGAFVAGLAAENLSSGIISSLPLFAALAVLLGTCLLETLTRCIGRRSPPSVRGMFLLLFFALGLLSGHLSALTRPIPVHLDPFIDRPDTLFLATIAAPPEIEPERIRLPLQLENALVDGKAHPVPGGVQLTLSRPRAEPALWLMGDRILTRLTLKPFHNFENPGGYDYVRSQAERGFYARAFVNDPRLVIKLSPYGQPLFSRMVRGVENRLDRFRQKAFLWLQVRLAPDAAAFYSALLLGYSVPMNWQEHLNRAGVTHLLSISGLHLGLVSLVTFWLACRLVRLLCPPLLKRTSDRHIALWAALLSAILYALISGLALPTWRSVIMLLLSFGAMFWYRSADSFSILATAALVILMIFPASLRQISFQLSFGALLGLLLLYPHFRRAQLILWDLVLPGRSLVRRFLNPFVDAFWVSLAATVMVMPLLITHFHGFSLAGLAANAVLVPLVGFLVLPPGLAALALFTVSETLALPVLYAGAWVLQLALAMIRWFSGLSWAFFWVGEIPWLWIFCSYTALALVLSAWSVKKKAAGLAFLLLLFSGAALANRLLPLRPAATTLEATFIDVGQGTSVLLRFPGGVTMLVDGGGFFDDSYDIGRYVLAPFLWHDGIEKLDIVVLSHDHPDHRNGLRFILSHFEVGSFWESGLFDRARGFDELAEIAQRRKIPILRLSELPAEQAIGPCRIRLLHPTPGVLQQEGEGEDLNNLSLVFQIDYGSTHLILPGDIDQSLERQLFREGNWNGPVLLVSPHHGSAHSNSTFLLDRLAPQAMVFTCGYANWFGFPAPAVLNECRRRNLAVYRTDLQGAIGASSDGTEWNIHAAR